MDTSTDETSASWSSALAEEFENLGPEEIHQYLRSKIDILNKKIAIQFQIAQDNTSEEESLENIEKTCDPEFATQLRLKRINSLTEVLKHKKLLDYIPFPSCLKLEIARELKQEINELENLVVKSKKELVDSKEELASLEKKIKSLDEIMERRNSEGEMVKEESFEAMNRAVNRQFSEHKRKLGQLLNDLYPDSKDEIRSVLRKLVDQYFEEGDDYIEMSADYDYRCIEFLFEADILERHPYEKNRIKLAKMCD